LKSFKIAQIEYTLHTVFHNADHCLILTANKSSFMRSINKTNAIRFAILFFSFCIIGLRSHAQSADCGPINSTKLKELLIGMGFSVKNTNESGKPDKFEIKNVNNGLDIPTSYEISPSTNYIWLTVFLGKANYEDSCEINTDLLKQNAIIQPCLFYITAKGNLMMGLPVENRAVTAAVLKRTNDFISKQVGNTKEYWSH